MQDNNLIFIISQPRSGSTLLQQIFSNTEKIATSNEPWILLPFISYDQPSIAKAIYNTYTAKIAFRDLEKMTGGSFAIKDYVKEMLLNIYGRLKGEKADYFLDKTPRYYEILPLIKDWFPGSKIIILKRNPLAVFTSIVSTWKRYSLLDLLEYKRDILDAPFLIQDFASQDDSHVKVINYESFISDPKKNAIDIFNWLGLPFLDDYMQFTDNEQINGRFGDPKRNTFGKVDPSNLERWKASLKNPNIESFINGYSKYLSADFLKGYGDYQSMEGKSTDVFEYFLYLSKYYQNSFPGYKIKDYYINKFKIGDVRKPIFQ